MQDPTKTEVNSREPQLAETLPQTYFDRWMLYLADIDEGRLAPQSTYHCWRQACWEKSYEAGEDADDMELAAKNTDQARGFLQQHEGHDATLEIDGDLDFADLEVRAKNILLREAIYRRYWVAAMSDEALLVMGG